MASHSEDLDSAALAYHRLPRPGKLEEIVFYNHPSVEARVRRAMEWKDAHPEPPTP